MSNCVIILFERFHNFDNNLYMEGEGGEDLISNNIDVNLLNNISLVEVSTPSVHSHHCMVLFILCNV